VRDGQLRLAWSAVLDLENARNPDAERAEAITLWRDRARVDISTTPAVEAIAEAIAERGVEAMDALHVASAITAGATWLLTTDLRLLRKMHGDDRIVAADPIDFIRYWQGDDDENRV
jgi:predicted nucleic acid-binding protein